ncbi:MAG TPA: hypothetical protein VHT75_01950 [Acidimicrobiales bacterium]|nr:hypothetical protein [Acidimicrobiales bacterium]
MVGASGAGAQTSTTCPASGYNSSYYPNCGTTTTAPVVSGNTSTTSTGLALTGEQAALPLAGAAGLIVLVLGARQLRRRTNN